MLQRRAVFAIYQRLVAANVSVQNNHNFYKYSPSVNFGIDRKYSTTMYVIT